MCYNPKIVRTAKNGYMLCRCGQCLECKRERQNDVAHRLWIASKSAPSIHFWTLTYSDEKMPLFIKAKDDYLQELGYDVTVTTPVREEKNLSPELRVYSDIPVDVIKREVYDDELGDFVPSYATGITRVVKHNAVVGRECAVLESLVGKDKSTHFYKYGDPLASRLTSVNDTLDLRGEFLNRDDKFQRIFVKKLSKRYFDGRKSDNSNYVMDYGNYTVAPSVCSRDIQLWIKRFKGCDGHKHHFKFKYYLYPEYGPQTDRPHYHMLTFGLTDSECEQMRREWIKMYGNEDSYLNNLTRFERKPLIDAHGDPAAAFVARYISKYISKGKYESPLVLNGYVKKPRALASTGLWSISEDEFRYYSGADLLDDAVREYVLSDVYKQLNPNDRELQERQGLWRFLPKDYYTDEILQQIKERQFYLLPHGNPDYKYSLGKSIKNKIYKYETERKQRYYDRETRTHYFCPCPWRVLSTPLSIAMSDFVRKRYSEDFLGKYRQIRQDEPYISYTQILDKIQMAIKSDQLSREKVSEENIRKFLQRTYF